MDLKSALKETGILGLQIHSLKEKISSDSDRYLEIFNSCGIHKLSNKLENKITKKSLYRDRYLHFTGSFSDKEDFF